MYVIEKLPDDTRRQRRMICERKIVTFRADTDQEAYEMAVQRAKEDETSWYSDGKKVTLTFLGIIELMSLEDEEDDVVWWVYEERLDPIARRDHWIPEKQELLVFKPIRRTGKMKV